MTKVMVAAIRLDLDQVREVALERLLDQKEVLVGDEMRLLDQKEVLVGDEMFRIKMMKIPRVL